MTEESLIEFPCHLPVKVMGRNTPQFRETMLAAAASEVGALAEEAGVGHLIARQGVLFPFESLKSGFSSGCCSDMLNSFFTFGIDDFALPRTKQHDYVLAGKRPANDRAVPSFSLSVHQCSVHPEQVYDLHSESLLAKS